MQICKEASGPDVSGNLTFRFNTRSRSIPVGTCTPIISVNAGTLVVKEDARSGYTVTDIYTIPANRLISKDLNDRTATVTIVQGNAASQTIVVFVNSKVPSQEPSPEVAANPAMTAVRQDIHQNPAAFFLRFFREGLIAWLAPTSTT